MKNIFSFLHFPFDAISFASFNYSKDGNGKFLKQHLHYLCVYHFSVYPHLSSSKHLPSFSRSSHVKAQLGWIFSLICHLFMFMYSFSGWIFDFSLRYAANKYLCVFTCWGWPGKWAFEFEQRIRKGSVNLTNVVWIYQPNENVSEGKKYNRSERNLCLVSHIFTKFSLIVYPINAQILITFHVGYILILLRLFLNFQIYLRTIYRHGI